MAINKDLNKGVISLEEGFKSRVKNFFNKASALFPVVITKQNDLHIVFFNYWTKKNKINIKNLVLSLSVYDQYGKLVIKDQKKIERFHNQISIKSILKDKYKNKFNGSVNVEILSLERLNFSFPAIIGIYQSGRLYSSVHSAGRIKDNNETQIVSYTDETNWSCKFKKGITPFFHYFVGPALPVNKNIIIKLLSKNGRTIMIKKLNIANIKPFGSKIFFIKDILKNLKFLDTDFISVRVEHNSIYPRMVVGNYHVNKKFFEVTHSFPKIYHKDYCPVIKDKSAQSKLSGYKNLDLDLSLKIFPTNCQGNFKYLINRKKFDQKTLQSDNKIFNLSQKKLMQTNIIQLGKKEEFLSLQMFGSSIPSRLNTSFIYKVKNKNSNFSVDIADGARSCVTPLKKSHWGHGYLGDGYQSIIMIINDNYEKFNNYKAGGVLEFYSLNFINKLKVIIKPNSILTIDVASFQKNKKLNKETQFFSWFLNLKKPGCEAFWLSYRKTDGAIFGDHSF